MTGFTVKGAISFHEGMLLRNVNMLVQVYIYVSLNHNIWQENLLVKHWSSNLY